MASGGLFMSEFLRYVLWELRRYSVLLILAGVAVTAVIGVIYFINKRKYGPEWHFPWKKVILPLIFACYLLMVIFATNMRVSGSYRQVNLHLFRAWREAWNDFSTKNWANVLLNIAMFMPLGFLLPLLSRIFRKWYVTIPAGALFSGLIELVQLIFMRGICDVDDLLCNTLGCAIGYFVIMTALSACGEKGKRIKSVLIYGFLTLISAGAIGSVFVTYQIREFGNLPDAAAYALETKDTHWVLSCTFPEVQESAPVYQTQPRSKEDCDAFADWFSKCVPTVFEDISYYQEAAYYMDHGNGDGAHFLYAHYLDQGYEYTAIYDDEPVWTDTDRETVLAALEKFALEIPESAEFTVEGDGWYRFTVDQLLEDEVLFDGMLRVRVAGDGSVREIENSLLSFSYYADAEVISPEEAYIKLCDGEFRDEDFFEMKNPSQIMVLSCDLEYRVDTKGFYQPVYVFDLASPDGDYQCSAMIPALK